MAVDQCCQTRLDNSLVCFTAFCKLFRAGDDSEWPHSGDQRIIARSERPTATPILSRRSDTSSPKRTVDTPCHNLDANPCYAGLGFLTPTGSGLDVSLCPSYIPSVRRRLNALLMQQFQISVPKAANCIVRR